MRYYSEWKWPRLPWGSLASRTCPMSTAGLMLKAASMKISVLRSCAEGRYIIENIYSKQVFTAVLYLTLFFHWQDQVDYYLWHGKHISVCGHTMKVLDASITLYLVSPSQTVDFDLGTGHSINIIRKRLPFLLFPVHMRMVASEKRNQDWKKRHFRHRWYDWLLEMNRAPTPRPKASLLLLRGGLRWSEMRRDHCRHGSRSPGVWGLSFCTQLLGWFRVCVSTGW